jgi:hypothetical protein
MSNTVCSLNVVEYFQKFLKTSLRCVRWINILGSLDMNKASYEKDYCYGVSRMIQVECLQYKIKDRGIYLNPFIGDLQKDLVEAIYKCRYWDRL